MVSNIFIRNVKSEDIEEVFKLSNQDYVREHSISKAKIQWDDHVSWFNSTVEESNSVFYIVTDDMDRFLGQVRFKIDNHLATVSISISNLIKGKGYSKILLSKSMEELFSEKREVKVIIAYVSDKNIPSVKLFKKVGFCFHENKEGLLKYIYFREEQK